MNVKPSAAHGTLLFVANDHFPNSHAVSVFRIDGAGVLSLVSGSPFETGQPGELSSLAAYPAKVCAPIPSFDLCLQDDSNGNLLRLESLTGNYQFTNCSGLVLDGVGTLTKKGGSITLQHYAGDRRVLAKIDTSLSKGTASLQLFPQGITFTITDRNTGNNTCVCRAP